MSRFNARTSAFLGRQHSRAGRRRRRRGGARIHRETCARRNWRFRFRANCFGIPRARSPGFLTEFPRSVSRGANPRAGRLGDASSAALKEKFPSDIHGNAPWGASASFYGAQVSRIGPAGGRVKLRPALGCIRYYTFISAVDYPTDHLGNAVTSPSILYLSRVLKDEFSADESSEVWLKRGVRCSLFCRRLSGESRIDGRFAGS